MLKILSIFKKVPTQKSLFSRFSLKPTRFNHSVWDQRTDLPCLAIVICLASITFAGLILQKEYLKRIVTTPITLPVSDIQPNQVTTKGKVTLPIEEKAKPVPKPKPKPKADSRVKRMQKYLNANRSPLAPYSQLIVSTSDKYKIDWRVIVAIAKVESSLGKAGPFPSKCKNAWGYNRYKFCYNSWSQSIPAFIKQANAGYPGMIPERMDNKYCTSCAKGEWAKDVRKAMASI